MVYYNKYNCKAICPSAAFMVKVNSLDSYMIPNGCFKQYTTLNFQRDCFRVWWVLSYTYIICGFIVLK